MKRTSAFLAIALSLACGGNPPPPPAPAPRVEEPPPPPPPNPWESMSGEALRNYVREQALSAMNGTEAATAEQVDGWLLDPDTAPEITGRRTERLINLAMVALAESNLDRAETIVRFIRSKAVNRNDAYIGTTILAEAARRRAADPEAAKTAIAEIFRELPATRVGGASVVFQMNQAPEQATARLEATKRQMLSLDTASAALFYEQVLPLLIEHRATFLDSVATVTAENARRRPPRPYRFATVDLTRDRAAQEVRVAVWDLGTQESLFPNQLYTNTGEQPNGTDDDGNGLIDDIRGVVQDVGNPPHSATLYDPGAEVIERYSPHLQGVMDLRAGMATTEAAQRVLEMMRSATTADEVEALETNLGAIGEWAHGTHVAGIMLAGIPQARMSVFRSAWAGEARLYHHRGPTDQELEVERQNIVQIASYINAHQVKVVNASLGFGIDYLADELRHQTDLYHDDVAVMARANQVQAYRTETWRQVFAACPSTLFVVAAGNENHDVMEYGDIPSGIEAANVIAVGAVDKFGAWATFTNSNPTRVRIFDFGVEVPSLVPNGQTVPLSGTSMASPNVANLAAKMYAVNPAITPAAIISIIVETGDAIAAPFNGRIANETKALQRARRFRAPATPAAPAAPAASAPTQSSLGI